MCWMFIWKVYRYISSQQSISQFHFCIYHSLRGSDWILLRSPLLYTSKVRHFLQKLIFHLSKVYSRLIKMGRKSFCFRGWSVTVTLVRKCNGIGLNKESKHTSRVLYYAAVTAQSCKRFPLPGILLAV